MNNPDSDRPHSDDWDEHFRQRFAHYKSAPPADALQRILAGANTSSPSGLGRNKWLFLGLGAILLTVSSWFVSHHNGPASAQLLADLTRKTQSARAPSVAATELDMTANRPPATEKVFSDGITGQSSKAMTRTKPITLYNTQNSQQPIKQTFTSEQNTVYKLSVPASTGTNQFYQTQPGSPLRSGYSREITRLSTPPSLSVGDQGPEIASSPVLPSSTDAAESVQSSKFAIRLNNKPWQYLNLTWTRPTVGGPTNESAPERPALYRRKPKTIVSFMPLYTYQRVNPIRTDGVLVRDIRTRSPLSMERAGIRLQIGFEWPISQRVALRTSLTYNHLSQQINYTTRSEKPDSVKIEMVDERTVRATPYFSEIRKVCKSNWNFVGAGADIIWQLGQLGGWRHYSSLGVSAGTFVGRPQKDHLLGFLQLAYGIERPITPSLWLRVAPTVQYGLNNVRDREGHLQTRPYTYGLTIGLRR